MAELVVALLVCIKCYVADVATGVCEHLAEYEEVVQDEYVYDFTEEEEWLLVAVTMLEGGNQTVNDKAMIMRVVLNRVESPLYPDNIYDVIYQPGQFSVASRLQYAVPNEGCYEALELIKMGWDESNGVMHFWGDGKVNHFY